MTDTQDDCDPPYCSFCDKGEADVRKLIAGHSAYICDECVTLCVTVIGAPATDDEAMKGLVGIWSEFTRRRQWTAAMLTGALAQLADPEVPEPRAWSRGAMMTSYVLRQMKPPQLLRPDRVLRCDYCSQPADQAKSLNVGHNGRICSDCLERMQETRAWWNPAYREDLIKRLQALADMPEPPHGSPG